MYCIMESTGQRRSMGVVELSPADYAMLLNMMMENDNLNYNQIRKIMDYLDDYVDEVKE